MGTQNGQGDKTTTRRCKSCGGELHRDSPSDSSPFCSKRCELNDLSKWFGEQYRIASHATSGTGPDSDADDGAGLRHSANQEGS